MLSLIAIIIAFLCFLLSALTVAVGTLNLTAWGLVFLAAYFLLSGIGPAAPIWNRR